MACHIIHLAVTVIVEPRHQARFLGGELGIGDAYFREAELAAPRPDVAGQRCEV
jgi:hypothetical protein